MIRRPPRSTPSNSSAASDVYKRQLPINSNVHNDSTMQTALSDTAVDIARTDNITPQTFTEADFVQCFIQAKNALWACQQHNCPGGDGGRMGMVGRAFNVSRATNRKQGRYEEVDRHIYKQTHTKPILFFS